MPRKAVLACLMIFFVSLACILSPSPGLQTNPTSMPFTAVPQEATQKPVDAGENTPVAPDVTEEPGRSAGIDLLPESSGTATPAVPPTQAVQTELHLFSDEWYPLNASAGSGDFSVTVFGWGIATDVVDSKPDPGFKFVMVDATLYNRGSAYRPIYSGSQSSLKDAAGTAYSINNIIFRYEADIGRNWVIAPGEHIRREFFFTVPENAPALTFQYDFCDGNSDQCGHPMLIQLSKASAGGEIPPEINSPDPGIHAIGEVLTQGEQAFSAIRWEVIRSPQQTQRADTPKGINLVQVNLLKANLSGQSLKLDSMAVHLKDRLGRYYVADAWAEGYLLAGEWAQAEYSFQVPPGVAGLELVVDVVDPVKKWPTLSRTFISLGDQPVLSDSALSHMLGSLAPNALPLGKPGQVDSFELAVQKVDFPNTSACSDIKPGERPVLVTVSVLNDTSADAESYALQAFIKDHQGFYYASCNRKDDRQAYGPLSPGASLSAQYSFLIPDLPGDLFLAQSKIGETDKKVFFLLK